MVGARRFVPGFVVGAVAVIIAALPPIGPLGAAGKAQSCDRPAPPTQSGRAAIAPGLNASKSPQQIAFTISLFSCSPARSTRGAGTLKSSITIKAAQTCSLLATAPHPDGEDDDRLEGRVHVDARGVVLVQWHVSQRERDRQGHQGAVQEPSLQRPVPLHGGRLRARRHSRQLRHREGVQEQDCAEPKWTAFDQRIDLRHDEAIRHHIGLFPFSRSVD